MRWLLGDSLRYVWSEVMVRAFDADIHAYVRGVVGNYIKGYDVSLPRRCTSLLDLYRILVWEMTFLRDVASAHAVKGAVLILQCATRGTDTLPKLRFASNVGWVGFEPNATIKAIGDDSFRNDGTWCAGIKRIDLSGLSNVTSIGRCFAFTCNTLESVNLSGLSRIRTIGDHFLSRKGWLRETTFLSKTGAKPVPGASAGGG